jgi:hypothetical protein
LRNLDENPAQNPEFSAKTPPRPRDFALYFRVFTLFPSPKTQKIRGNEPKIRVAVRHDLTLFVLVSIRKLLAGHALPSERLPR